MKLKLLISLLACCWAALATNCPVGYAKDHTITLNSGQVSNGPLANYILRIHNVGGDYATVANGGQATSASGFDIIPANAAGSQMTFDIYRYDPATGNFEMDVLVP